MVSAARASFSRKVIPHKALSPVRWYPCLEKPVKARAPQSSCQTTAPRGEVYYDSGSFCRSGQLDDVLIDSVDPLGRRITLSRDTWERHIAKRPELEGQLQYVEETVRDPDFVVKARDGSHRYYAAGISGRHPKLYVHVLVRLLTENEGTIRTAWFSGAVEEGELEWMRERPRRFGGD